MSEKKLRFRVEDDLPVISVTDVRDNFAKVYGPLLEKYGKVMVESGGEEVCAIVPPEWLHED